VKTKQLLIKIVKLKELTTEEYARIVERRRLAKLGDIETKVKEIIRRVRELGDYEIIEFYEKIFGKKAVTKHNLKVSEEEFEKAYEKVSEEFVEALKEARRNIEVFHKAQIPGKMWIMKIREGVYAGRVWKPLERVGIYVPGGRAPYPSTALMASIPAKVAGVREIIACTPPLPNGEVNPYTLVALDIVGVKGVFKVGGAHAVAAMAYGTETIPKVDKIVGPGNIWVVTAKKLLSTIVSIDFIAGPSEIMIIADETADPYRIALDLAAQAEHDPLSSSILITTSENIAKKVAEKVEEIVRKAPRREIIKKSLENSGLIILVENIDEALKFANDYAPEHLEIVSKKLDMFEILEKIDNAGSIFIGENTPVALGDYIIGTNHILPTEGQAKVRGGLSVYDFIKFIDFQYVTKRGLETIGKYAIVIAEAEGFYEHANSIRERLVMK